MSKELDVGLGRRRASRHHQCLRHGSHGGKTDHPIPVPLDRLVLRSRGYAFRDPY